MCALPSTGPQRSRITPVQWIGLAVLGLLLLNQFGLLDFANPGRMLRQAEDSLPFLVAIILAVTVHEFSHALVATLFGDPLPRRMGRLTLNPLAHLDLLGSLLFLVAHFGWGKPVQINPAAMRHPGVGWALSSVAGPVSNLLAATVGAAVLHVEGVQMDPSVAAIVDAFLGGFVVVNVGLAVFNLIPLPPLDGFGFVFGLAPQVMRRALLPVQAYGPWVLLALIFLPQFVPGFPPVLTRVVLGAMRTILGALDVSAI